MNLMSMIYNMPNITHIWWDVHIKQLQQTGKYLQCEYTANGKTHISFHCQFVKTSTSYYHLYDFKNIYDPISDWNVIIWSMPEKTTDATLPSNIAHLWQYSNTEAIESTNIRNLLNLPPLQKTMSKLETLMIDIYLKDKKNLKRITDFSTQLKIKTNALRARRDELQKQREEIVNEIYKIENIYNELEEAIEEWNIQAIEEMLSKEISQALPLK